MTTMQYLLLCLVLFSFAASNAAAQGAEGTEIQITDNGSYQRLPAIYGDRIAWTDERNINLPDDIENMTISDIFDLDTDIYIYNLSTGEEVYTLQEYPQVSPAIYGDMIVWEDYSNANLPGVESFEDITLEDVIQFDVDIYVADLSSGQEGFVTENSSWQGEPAIYDDRVVYQDLRNGNWNIYLFNLSSGEELQITDNESDQLYPAIYENTIVWQDYRNGIWNIYMYNLSTREEMPVSASESDQVGPAIYGDVIVWEDYGNADIPEDVANMTFEELSQLNADISMYNLTSGEDALVTSNSSWQGSPAIYGDRIVWEDLRNSNFDVYTYNLSTGEELQITENEWSQMYPAIYGDRIVWQDYRNGNWDIYMYDMSVRDENGTSTDTSNQVSADDDTTVREDNHNVNTSEDMNNMQMNAPKNYDNTLNEGYEEIFNATADTNDPAWLVLGGMSTSFMMYEGDEIVAYISSSTPVNVYLAGASSIATYGLAGFDFVYDPTVSAMNVNSHNISYRASYNGERGILVEPINPEVAGTMTMQVFQKKQDSTQEYDLTVRADRRIAAEQFKQDIQTDIAEHDQEMEFRKFHTEVQEELTEGDILITNVENELAKD
ncbi:hypothetical protein [Methanomethylovorans sp.]|uniref:hypothetical protein n=1 Tax=Methanomethylovorans sp. TaxID=2758717 RepID=UPI00351CB6B1